MQIQEFKHSLWKPNSFLEKRFRRRFWRLFLSFIGPRYTLKTVDGIQSVVDLRDLQGVSKQLLKTNEYEDFARDLSKNWIHEHSNIIDIGANIGFWTIHCSRLTTGSIYAFEPDPKNLELLKSNIELNRCRNVEIIEKACSDENTKLKLYISNDNFGDHQLYPSGEKRDSVEVEVCRIDDELGAIDHVDFVKIDVQGFEEFALKGMTSILEQNQNVVILCEFWPDGMQAAGSNPEALFDWLEGLGFKWSVIPHLEYRVAKMSRSELFKLCANNHYADVIFSRNEKDLML